MSLSPTYKILRNLSCEFKACKFYIADLRHSGMDLRLISFTVADLRHFHICTTVYMYNSIHVQQYTLYMYYSIHVLQYRGMSLVRFHTF